MTRGIDLADYYAEHASAMKGYAQCLARKYNVCADEVLSSALLRLVELDHKTAAHVWASIRYSALSVARQDAKERAKKARAYISTRISQNVSTGNAERLLDTKAILKHICIDKIRLKKLRMFVDMDGGMGQIPGFYKMTYGATKSAISHQIRGLRTYLLNTFGNYFEE